MDRETKRGWNGWDNTEGVEWIGNHKGSLMDIKHNSNGMNEENTQGMEWTGKYNKNGKDGETQRK